MTKPVLNSFEKFTVDSATNIGGVVPNDEFSEVETAFINDAGAFYFVKTEAELLAIRNRRSITAAAEDIYFEGNTPNQSNSIYKSAEL